MRKWLRNDGSQMVNPINFAGINEEMFRKAAIKTKGETGHSTMDADGWRGILCSSSFCNKNLDLRKVLISFIKIFGQRNCQAFPLKHLLYANSSLFTKIQVYNQQALRNSFAKLQQKSLCWYLGKKQCHDLGHFKHCRARGWI